MVGGSKPVAEKLKKGARTAALPYRHLI